MHPLMIALTASAGLGAMIGLVRQWDQRSGSAQPGEYAGVRTFTLWSLLGCVGAFLSDGFSVAILPVVLVAVGVHFVVSRPPSASGGTGATTFAAALLTVLVGALVYWQQHQEAVLVSALMAVLLGLKNPIHDWTRKFTSTDIRSTLQFVAVTGVILPLVPDRAYGPFDGFNPHSTWMMVVLISGIGFVGYVLMRLFDERAGITLTSLLGGVASSTATTLAFSRRSRDDSAHSEAYALAVAIACTIMIPRVLVIIGLLNRDLAAKLLLPFGCLALPGILYAAWSWRRQRRATAEESASPALQNPLSLMMALKFGLLYALTSFLVKAAAQSGQLQSSLLPLAFVSGLTDLDAISLSVARTSGTAALASDLAARAVVIAAIANSLLKTVFAVSLGSPRLRKHVSVLMALTVAAGMVGFFLIGDTPPAVAPATP